MSELRTKLVHRNDTTAQWELHSGKILLKGEVGIEFLTDGTAKVKIGDGVSTWAELPYFGGDVSALESLIGTVPEGKTVMEVVEAIEASAAEEHQRLQDQINTILSNPDAEGAINSITEFTAYINEHGEIAEGFRADIDANTKALDNKVDKQEGYRMISADEGTKLEKLVLGENGEVSVSGKVAAGNVEGLEDWITTRAATLEGLSENNLSDALLEHLQAAEPNVLEGVQVNGTVMEIAEKMVNIKTSDLVKGTDEITVADDGALGIGEVNVTKLVQTEGTRLILNGGSAAD